MKFSLKPFYNPRLTEHLHVLFWLIKDICWVLEVKTLGVLMIVPTILIAIYMVGKTSRSTEFYVNLSILFWISANSYWMCAEFFDFAAYKNYAAIPFAFGLISFFVYLFKYPQTDTNIK